MNRLLAAASLTAVISFGAAMESHDPRPNGPAATPVALQTTYAPSIIELATEAGSFTTLLAAVEIAELDTALAGEGPFTVLAPTDDAFGKLDPAVVDLLLQPANRDALQRVLLGHVVSGRVSANAAVSAARADTLSGDPVRFAITEGRLNVNGARVVANDLEASNGIVHVIDTVLVPANLELSAEVGPREIIELAVERGAPLFNEGQIAACAAIYEVTAQSLLGLAGDDLSESARTTLRTALRDASREHSPREQAWILRRAFDAIYPWIDREAMTTRRP